MALTPPAGMSHSKPPMPAEVETAKHPKQAKNPDGNGISTTRLEVTNRWPEPDLQPEAASPALSLGFAFAWFAHFAVWQRRCG